MGMNRENDESGWCVLHDYPQTTPESPEKWTGPWLVLLLFVPREGREPNASTPQLPAFPLPTTPIMSLPGPAASSSSYASSISENSGLASLFSASFQQHGLAKVNHESA